MVVKKLLVLGLVVLFLVPNLAIAGGKPVNCAWSGGPEKEKSEWFITVKWDKSSEDCEKINPLFTHYAVLTSEDERTVISVKESSYTWHKQATGKTYLVGCSTEDGNAIDFAESCIANLSFNPVKEGGERNE